MKEKKQDALLRQQVEQQEKELEAYRAQRPLPDAKPLMILGNGPTAQKGKQFCQANKSIPVWGVNYERDCDLLWQMHSDTFIKARRKDPAGSESKLSWMEWIKSKPVTLPVMMQRGYPYLAGSMAYPIREIAAHFGMSTLYSGNTISYMLAYAIYQRCWNPIHMYGVDYYYECREESVGERPCTEYWMGYAQACGISIGIPDGSRIMSITTPLRTEYGYNYCPPLEMDELNDFHEPTYEIIEDLQKELRELKATGDTSHAEGKDEVPDVQARADQ